MIRTKNKNKNEKDQPCGMQATDSVKWDQKLENDWVVQCHEANVRN